MTTERTAEEWGRVAVSLPGWRWVAGMLDSQELGRAVEGYDEFGAELGITSDEVEVWSACSEGYARNKPLSDRALPDPDDPATAGALLSMLGKLACPWRRNGLWVVTTGSTGEPFDPKVMTPRTLGRACIAAAEALGRWPGGAK